MSTIECKHQCVDILFARNLLDYYKEAALR